MSHLVSKQPWGTLDLDTNAGSIFFQEDWFYNWSVDVGASAWTLAQKRHFHNTLDKQIWGKWSNRFRLRVSGSTPFCRRFAATGVPINFDIHWVLRPGHWTVNVRKLPAGSTPTTFISNVLFATRVINLDSADLTPYSAGNAAGANNPRFAAGPHEFGHTFDNRDEYNAPAAPRPPRSLGDLGRYAADVGAYVHDLALLLDSASILNIGTQVRSRHLQLIVQALNALTPGCTWTAPIP
ncbi:MAG TPA: hypothetical protein VFG68_17950 [Fimbriiglobus sp.]|nr:hypothetical protein [Fimbriiglobus sp.]